MAILAAVGGAEHDDRVVSVGYDLATAYNDTLLVLNVVPEDEFETFQAELQEIEEFSDYSFTREEQSAAAFAAEIVDAAPGERDPERVETIGRVGNPTAEILGVGADRDVRYLVVGGRKRTPVGKALFGSTTQAVLLEATRPVVTAMSEA